MNKTSPSDFPVDLLPDIAHRFAYEVACALRVPIELPAVSVLAAASASIGRGLEIQSTPDEVMRGNLYFLGAARSGDGKTRTIKQAASVILDYQKQAIAFWKYGTEPRARTEQKLLKAEMKKLQGLLSARKPTFSVDRATIIDELREKIRRLRELEDDLHSPQYIVEDCTVESLAPALAANNEEIFSLSADAGKVLLNLQGRYNKKGEIDDNFYLKSFSGDHHIVNRNSHSPIVLYQPTISLLWLAQPDLLTRIFQNIRLLSGGLLARCLSFNSKIEPTEIPETPRRIDADVKAEYQNRIRELMSTYLRLKRTLRIPDSPQALEVIRCYHNTLVADRLGKLADISSIVARWHELALRVAMVLHAFVYGKEAHLFPIAEETAQDAVSIIDWFTEQEFHLPEPSREQQREERLNHLIRIIQTRYNGRAPIRDLRLRNGFERDEIDELAKTFSPRIIIEIFKNPQGAGRPAKVVRVL
jgi:Protein of unknown function (DUF3987)